MTHALQAFNYGASEVRTVMVDGTVRFVAKDLADILGYKWNGSARIAHVPEEWRGTTSVVTPSGEQEMAVLTEEGMYFFLGRSDKPLALPLQKFVAGEVLPAIRKTGSYSITPRDPITEIDRFAGMMTQVIPALNDRLVLVEAAQKELDPKKLTDGVIAHLKTMGEMRGQIKKLVNLVVVNAKKQPEGVLVAKGWNHYAKVYPLIHAQVGVGALPDYATVEQANHAIELLRGMLKTMGAKIPSQLRLVG